MPFKIPHLGDTRNDGIKLSLGYDFIVKIKTIGK
jgi:hypothetical protein